MAIVDYSAPAIPEKVIGKAQEDGTYRRVSNGQTNGNGAPRPRVKVWGNVGYFNKGRFISTPLGIAIDTMEPGDTSGSNAEVVAVLKLRNKLLATFQKIGAGLGSGEHQDLSNIVFRIQRVREDADTSEEMEEFDIDLMDLFMPAPKQEAAE